MKKIAESEYHFLRILWECEPISSTELVRICNQRLGWKKSTTYTVIKNLSNKEIIKNENTIVSSLVSKEKVDRQESDALVERMFQGNIPSFFSAFFKDRDLSREDIERIQRIIDEAGEREKKEEKTKEKEQEKKK